MMVDKVIPTFASLWGIIDKKGHEWALHYANVHCIHCPRIVSNYNFIWKS